MPSRGTGISRPPNCFAGKGGITSCGGKHCRLGENSQSGGRTLLVQPTLLTIWVCKELTPVKGSARHVGDNCAFSAVQLSTWFFEESLPRISRGSFIKTILGSWVLETEFVHSVNSRDPRRIWQELLMARQFFPREPTQTNRNVYARSDKTKFTAGL